MMTFEELKFQILDKQRKIEINKIFHLYVKAESYSDILKIIKSESNFKWILQNGFRDLISEFPVEELEAENFYQREVELSDMNADIIMLSGGYLHLTQSGKNRCRIIADGARVSANLSDMAMVEVESFQSAIISITSNNYAYAYLTPRNNSLVNLYGNGNSTFCLNSWNETNTQAYLQPKSYIYFQLNDNSKINISDGENS